MSIKVDNLENMPTRLYRTKSYWFIPNVATKEIELIPKHQYKKAFRKYAEILTKFRRK